MTEEYRVVDIWVGRFPSESELDAYLAETCSGSDDVPISRFAADQNELFYDHDFIEAGFHPSTDDFANLIEGHSFAPSYLDAATEAFASAGIRAANVLLLAFGKEIGNPQSIEQASYSLTYLGRFDCDPDAATDAPGDAGIPALAYLLIAGAKALRFNGQSVASIPVDWRGLVIGRDGPAASVPRLDISPYVDAVANDQVKIYQDQFDQWVIEDVAGNGLTQINGEELSLGRTFPWHGKRLSIGSLQFEWSTKVADSAN